MFQPLVRAQYFAQGGESGGYCGEVSTLALMMDAALRNSHTSSDQDGEVGRYVNSEVG